MLCLKLWGFDEENGLGFTIAGVIGCKGQVSGWSGRGNEILVSDSWTEDMIYWKVMGLAGEIYPLNEMIFLLQNAHKGHSIARPKGRAMEWPLWVQTELTK